MSRTLLEGVNSVLTDMGRNPVNQVSTSQNPESAEIQSLILFTTKEVLMRGWQCNRRRDVSLSPDTSGNIILPANTLSVILSDSIEQTNDLPENITYRDGKLYDLTNGTYDFSDYSSILVHIIEAVDFDELPIALQDFIIDKTAYEFAKKRVPDPQLQKTLEIDMSRSYSIAVQEEARNLKANALTGNKSTYDIVSRRWNPRRRY